MFKKLLITFAAGSMTLFLITACAEDSSDENTVESSSQNGQSSAQQDASLMNQPVDFSSPEAVEKTLQDIRDKEGDKAYSQLDNAMKYLMVYDLSVSNNKEKLYEKLNGMTPEEIIAKMRR